MDLQINNNARVLCEFQLIDKHFHKISQFLPTYIILL